VEIQRVIPVLGMLVMIGIAWSLSSHRKRFPWRVVIGGLAMQITMALIVLQIPLGKAVFEFIGGVITNLLDCVDRGAGFVFGTDMVETSRGPMPAYRVSLVAFKVLPTIIFFSSLMSILYYLGVMQLVVGAISRVMQKTLGTSGAETLSAAGNIFVGQTEAPLLVRPYLNTMTKSELMAVMVGGFATIAGGVMAAYADMGISPVHLLSASLMSAPAAIVIAKIMQPEVDQPLTLGKVEVTPPMEATNVIDAAARGASDGMKLALNVGAMLIAFLALLYMLDSLVGYLSGLLGPTRRITFTQIMGYVSFPFAWLMGIETKDCFVAGEVLGTRIVSNEFIAYLQMNPDTNPAWSGVSDRTKTILTYALCGFANIGSIGIQLGGLGPIAPDRRDALVKLGLRAMIGGLLACYMTACLASIFVS
jgi:concentrative nucleoside transporter, CNT family